jgi:hypothetical protein
VQTPCRARGRPSIAGAGTAIASLLHMRTATRLVIFGSAIGAAVMIGRRRRTQRSAPSAVDGAASDAGDVPLPAGISEVDPQPLTQISAEGIDPDATRAAHEAPRDQRERLAIPGKNLP